MSGLPDLVALRKAAADAARDAREARARVEMLQEESCELMAEIIKASGKELAGCYAQIDILKALLATYEVKP